MVLASSVICICTTIRAVPPGLVVGTLLVLLIVSLFFLIQRSTKLDTDRLTELQNSQNRTFEEQARVKEAYLWQMMNHAVNGHNKPDQNQQGNLDPQRRTRKRKGGEP